jgi:hypothetical protein
LGKVRRAGGCATGEAMRAFAAFQTFKRFVLAIGFALIIAPSAHAERDSVTCLGGLACLDQGWSDADRNMWYRTTQGSRLLPLNWMQALELAGSQDKFMSDANMARLGYLPEAQSDANPEGLPVGFTVDQDRTSGADLMCDVFPAMCESGAMRRAWVGMNCSACHTNDIQIGNTRLRVEGAPTLADFQGLEEGLLAALKETLDSPSKFQRFADIVLGAGFMKEEGDGLREELAEQISWQQELHDKNDAPVRYGHGRLDAQGHILNKVALTTRVPPMKTVLADAPASYPFVWNTSQQAKIQWNGIATNKARIKFFGLDTDLGALIRNTSEVIGVFAHVETNKGKAWRGYSTSARVAELIGLERKLASLQSPQWPSNLLGPLDAAKAAAGKDLFVQKCGECHDHLKPEDTTTQMKERMDPIAVQGTDIFLACNTFLHESRAGNFEGQKTFGFVGERLKKVEFTRNMLINATVGTIIGKKDELLEGMFADTVATGRDARGTKELGIDYLPGVTDPEKKKQAEKCLTTKFKNPGENILQYKSRSLNGIWATAPYLHNGSVPTLYDLLLPSSMQIMKRATDAPIVVTGDKRPTEFGVGSRKFDPVKVGFSTDLNDADNTFVYQTINKATGEPIPGNYNSGHDYGNAALSESDRQNLLEYLKSL